MHVAGGGVTIKDNNLRMKKTHIIDNTASWKQEIAFYDEADRIGAKIIGQREVWSGALMGLQFETGAVGSTTARLKLTSGGNTIVNPVGGNGVYSESLLTIKSSDATGNHLHMVQSNDNRGWRMRAKDDGHFYLLSTYSNVDTQAMKIAYDTGVVDFPTHISLTKAVDPKIYSGAGIGLNIDGSALYLNRFSGAGVAVNSSTAISKFQVGGNTFSGSNGTYSDARLGMMVNGSLTSIVYASTYNDATYPDYGLVFIHGANTSNYNVWAITPDGPAKGNRLNFIYQLNSSNIHSQTPKGYMDGSGNFVMAGDITAYGSPSDLRLKNITGKVPNALASVLKLNGYKFDWKKTNDICTIKEDIGVIAQEVAALFPELARTNDDGYMSVRYQGLTAVLIEAIKEQQKQIDELKKQVA
jgi:hypothetical protein